MKMRELEERTGVNREVIRVLLRKGLIPEPRRLARNAAEYDESHVRAVLAVRGLQRDGRLTLDEIGGALQGSGLATRNSASMYRHLDELLSIRFGLTQTGLISISSMMEKYPSADRDARAFARMGMLTITESDDGPQLNITDSRLVEIWGEIRKAGFVEESGFPPENISFYLQSAESVASHEAAVFFSGSEGKITEDQAAVMLQTALPLMLEFFGILRINAFMQKVRETAEKATEL